MPELTQNAIEVLEARYLVRNEKGKIVETPDEMWERVAGAIAASEEEK